MAGAIYLADTTVYVLQDRYPQVRRHFTALLTEGRLAACQMTALEKQHWPDVRVACIVVFEGRAKHAWPPDVTVHRSWEAGYRALAEQTAFAVGNVHDAAHVVGQLIASIDKAR